MKRQVLILVGPSGIGKSTYASIQVAQHSGLAKVVSADHFFEKEVPSEDDSDKITTVYDFDPRKIGEAHEACKLAFFRELWDGEASLIIVDNTNTQEWEWRLYAEAALQEGCSVSFRVFDAFDRGVIEMASNTPHGTPVGVILEQAYRLDRRVIHDFCAVTKATSQLCAPMVRPA